MPLKLPALDPKTVEPYTSTGYPEPYRSRMGERAKRRLGEASGLTKLGVNLVTLGSGGQSALRHWHTLEDELIYVVDGEVTLVTNEGEQVLRAGQYAAFKAGDHNAHCFVNRSAQPARYLEIGTRVDADKAHYPDDDLMWGRDEHGKEIPLHKDGTRYPP